MLCELRDWLVPDLYDSSSLYFFEFDILEIFHMKLFAQAPVYHGCQCFVKLLSCSTLCSGILKLQHNFVAHI